MNDKIIDLMQYKQTLENKRDLDNETKTLDDLSLEEIEDVSQLYIKEIQQINKEIILLKKENEMLKNNLYN